MADPIRVLIVDDSVVIRRLLATIIDADPDLEVAGIAQNGNIAIQRIKQLNPDAVTLDVEMPELDGLGTLKELRKEWQNLPVVMFSTLTGKGAEATLSALALGASDYVTKPANVGSFDIAMERVRDELVPKLKALCRPSVPAPAPAAVPMVRAGVRTGRIDLVAVGTSTGGPNALADVLGSLPATLPVPIVIVQHMPALFTSFLAQRLDKTSAISVQEGAAGMRPEPGCAYIAPGDFHMTVNKSLAGELELAVNQDAPENFCRPAVDVLFRSVARTVGGNALAVVLTGMGHDGRDGCIPLREAGAQIIAQDQTTSVVWGMPGAVTTAGLADDVFPLSEIGPTIAGLVSRERRLAPAATTRT